MQQLAAERGFTLLEVMFVMTIVVILIAMPVASYVTFTRRANDATAKANLQIVLPAIEGFHANNQTYLGMTLQKLKNGYDRSIDPASYTLTDLTDSSYCVASSSGSQTWRREGPGAAMVQGGCS